MPTDQQQRYNYVLELADNALILGQRLGERCGHGPSLETDIACTNIALDLLGQTRSYYQYAASLKGEDATEDSIAMLRTEREYRNVLLVEQPNTDFAYIIVRGFLFDAFHLLLLQRLVKSTDETLAAIAARAIKEVRYHRSFSAEWLKRIGSGTPESHRRTQAAVDELFRFTGEFFRPTAAETAMVAAGVAPDTTAFRQDYYDQVTELLREATLTVPDVRHFRDGGKQGIHSEHFGYLLNDLQFMQRTYPNMSW